MAQCGCGGCGGDKSKDADGCGGACGGKMMSADVKPGDIVYQAMGCGMTYSLEDAQKCNFICGMCKQRILPTQKTANGTVSLGTNPWPSKTGKDRVEVVLRDANRNAVKGAKVAVTLCYTGKQPQTPLTLKQGKDGTYGVDYKLAAAGKWTATVAVTKNGKTATYKFDFEVA